MDSDYKAPADSSSWRLNIPVVVLCLSWLVYGVSLVFPAFHCAGGQYRRDYLGLECVVCGWIGLEEWPNLAWLANPLYLFASISICRQRHLQALIAALGALPVATTAFFKESQIIDESGSPWPIESHGAGFYLWLTALGLALAASVIAYFWRQGPKGRRPVAQAESSRPG